MMKSKSSLSKRQRGSFAIELAFVLVALCSIFLFSTDLSHKLLVRAKLDRSSFALSNVIKERTRYFESDIAAQENLHITQSDLEGLINVASRMLNTESSDVAIQIESMTNASTITLVKSQKFDDFGCNIADFDDFSDLAPHDGGVIYPLYRVSLCEVHDSWFEAFFGDSSSMAIVSSSIMPGR
ncbi:tight adherence pilus pseudopilin TadF [Vibrio astriarenae]